MYDATRLASQLDRPTEVAISAGLGLLMANGFVASYDTLRDLAVTAARPRRSTGGWNTSAEARSGSATSPLHRQVTPGDRRLQTPTTPSIVKSRFPPAAGAAACARAVADGYLPVYAAWAAVVVIAFPPVCDFV